MKLLGFVGLLLMVSFASQGASEQSSAPTRIQFVGNSFTYYNNGIPHHLSALMKSSRDHELQQPQFTMQTISGGKLQEHIAGVKSQLSSTHRARRDAIILQPYSTEAITAKLKPAFTQALTALLNEARSAKTKPYLLMTWPYEGDFEMWHQLQKSFYALQKKHDVNVIPVGLAFYQVQKKYPDIKLYTRDIAAFDNRRRRVYANTVKHPSEAGTYLAAATVYAYLYQRSPEGLSYIASLPPSQAKTLQKAAWGAVEGW